MPLIRGSIKSTSEQWTLVWLSLASPTCITWVMVRQENMLRNFNPCNMWFLNSLERKEAKPCHSSMPTQGVICLPQCLALSLMDKMCWMFFVLQTLLLPWPKTHPALSPNPRIWHVWNTWLCWCRLQTVVKPLSVLPENGFPPMARSLWTQYHQHSMLCSNMQTCALVVAAFTKMLSFLVPLYEAKYWYSLYVQ